MGVVTNRKPSNESHLEHIQQSLTAARISSVLVYQDTAKVQEAGVLVSAVQGHHLKQHGIHIMAHVMQCIYITVMLFCPLHIRL